MNTATTIIMAFTVVVAVIGGIPGLIAFFRTEGSLCKGSMTSKFASDDDLRPHPRYRRS
jgi:hypothetical protein